MKIAKKTRYAVRLILELSLAYYDGDKTLSLHTIAKNEDISFKFLSQIIISLKNAGILTAERGAKGGYRLLKKPTDISIYDIYRILEGEPYFTECLENGNYCQRQNNCLAKEVWQELSLAFSEKLKEINFGQLVKRAKIRNISSDWYYQI